MKVKAKDLKLADTVRLHTMTPEKFNDATVKQIQNGWVTLYRAYVLTQDFSYTGGVICSVGIEEFKVSIDNPIEFELLDSKQLK